MSAHGPPACLQEAAEEGKAGIKQAMKQDKRLAHRAARPSLAAELKRTEFLREEAPLVPSLPVQVAIVLLLVVERLQSIDFSARRSGHI